MIDVLKSLIKQFMPFAQEQMGFDRNPKINLRNNKQEANNPMGKTGFYNPNDESVTIYIGGRHPKDIMRSLAHELMHHTQNCNGDFDNIDFAGEQGYAQNNPQLRTMEIQAYKASIVFRDWEDSCKGTIYYEHLQKGDNKMSTKDWKNKEIKGLLTEQWGFKMDLSKLNENKKEYDLDENADERVFAPNHYCAHHVKFEGREAHTVDHNWDETLQEVTEYDLKFEDGSVERNVPASQLEVIQASELDEGEMHKRDHPKVKKVKKMKEEEVEESAQGRRRTGKIDPTRDDIRTRPMEEAEEELEEDKMPDENNDGVPDYAQDGKGANDLGKEKTKPKKKKGGKVPPQLAKHTKKKGKMDEARMREIIAYALKNNKE
jgi:hypothetical protein